jgi:hypothetical protein
MVVMLTAVTVDEVAMLGVVVVPRRSLGPDLGQSVEVVVRWG